MFRGLNTWSSEGSAGEETGKKKGTGFYPVVVYRILCRGPYDRNRAFGKIETIVA